MTQEYQSVDSYALIGQQSAIDSRITAVNSMVRFIYEATDLGIVARAPQITPDRMGSASQVKNISGKYEVGGGLQLFFHVGALGVLLKHACMAAETTTQVAQQELKASAAFTDGVQFTIDTQPNATNPTVNPCKLEINLSGMTGSGTSIVIAGTNNLDTTITETITISGQPAQTVSTKFFKTVTGVTINGLGGTVQIDGDMGLWKHDFVLGNKPLNGLTVEVVKGEKPNTYWNLVPDTFNFSMTDGNGMQATTELMGTHFALGENINSGPTPSDTSGWTESGRMPSEIFADWSTVITVAGLTHEAVSMAFSMNNNLVQPPRNRGVRNPAYPKRNGSSEITHTFTVPYVDPTATSTLDFDQYADDDTAVVVAQTNVWQINDGPEYQLIMNIPRGQIANLSDPTVTIGGDLVREVTIRPIRTVAQTTRDEVNFTLYNDLPTLEGVGYTG